METSIQKFEETRHEIERMTPIKLQEFARDKAKGILVHLDECAQKIKEAKAQAYSAKNEEGGFLGWGKTARRSEATADALVTTNDALAELSKVTQEGIVFSCLTIAFASSMADSISDMLANGFETRDGRIIHLEGMAKDQALIMVKQARSYAANQTQQKIRDEDQDAIINKNSARLDEKDELDAEQNRRLDEKDRLDAEQDARIARLEKLLMDKDMEIEKILSKPMVIDAHKNQNMGVKRGKRRRRSEVIDAHKNQNMGVLSYVMHSSNDNDFRKRFWIRLGALFIFGIISIPFFGIPILALVGYWIWVDWINKPLQTNC